MKEPKIIPMQVTHEMFITFGDNAFSGHDTKVRIVKYTNWTEVSVFGAGRAEAQAPMRNVPLSVLKELVELCESLP